MEMRELSAEVVLTRAQGAYERRRLTVAACVAAPLAVLPLVSFGLGTSGVSALVLGVGLCVVSFVCVWRGGGLSFANLSGLKAGVVPLVFAHVSKLFGHACTPEGCTTYCVPACTAGGFIAGLMVEYWARHSSRPNVTRGVGALAAVLVGGLGCSCVGYSGLAGLVAGLSASLLAGLVSKKPALR